METTTERQAASVQTNLSLSLLKIKAGHNPRQFFDPEKHLELVENIRDHGILQPILVRPKDDHFEVVAGERRYRAAVAVADGAEYQIPVVIREMTDRQMDLYAFIENKVRDNMSATEEAVTAAKVLGFCKGDREEAARELGYSLSTLNNRLALMNCSEQVRTALNERTITLGHAELFASLSKDKQDLLLPQILVRKMTVNELRAIIEKAACKLDSAVFDKTDCAACPHNSTAQAAMFGESIAGGNCTNKACYTKKTDDTINTVADGLKDEYPVIRIVRVGDNETRTALVADGPKGVGAAQAEACQACANFGAAVSALPGSESKVFKNQCFDTACNSKKIAARIKADEAADLAEKAAASGAGTPGAPDAPKYDATGKAVPAAKGKPAAAEKVVTSVSEGDRVKAYREAVWRKAMAKEIVSNPTLSPQYLIALCLNGNARQVSETKLKEYFGKLGGVCGSFHDLGEVAGAVIASPDELQQKLLVLLAVTAMESLDVHKLRQLAVFHKLDLTKHWKMDKALLDLLTKSEIKVIATEIKLDAVLGAEFNKAFSEKKDDLIKKLLGVEGFDYSATIPKVMKV